MHTRDDQWEKIYVFLKDYRRADAGEEAECRLFAWLAPEAEHLPLVIHCSQSHGKSLRRRFSNNVLVQHLPPRNK